MAKNTRPKTSPIPIRIPDGVLKEIDEAAAEEYESRAGWLAKVIVEKIIERRKEKAAKGKGK